MWAVRETTTYPLPPFPCPEYSVLLVLLLQSGCEHNVGTWIWNHYHTPATHSPIQDKNIINRQIRLNLPRMPCHALGNQIQTCCSCLLFVVVCCSVSSLFGPSPESSSIITNLAAHDHHAGRHAGWHHGVVLSTTTALFKSQKQCARQGLSFLSSLPPMGPKSYSRNAHVLCAAM